MPAPGRPYYLLAKHARAPIVLTCEHASNRIPGRPGGNRALRELLAGHWAYDLGAWRLTRDLARRLGTSAIGARWSRLWIDLNRRVGDAELVRATAGGIALPWNATLTPGEVERRVLACHAPYHEMIDRLILQRLLRGVRPLVFAVHTFTPRWNGRLRQFDLGLLFAAHRAPAQQLARHLRAGGLVVRYNQPYSGMAGMMYAAERHGSHHGLPCVEVEVNQALLARRAPAARLGAMLAAALRELTARPH